MRNDARPIGEKLREIEDRGRQERGVTRQPPERGRDTSERKPERKPFVTDRDAGDEEQSGR